TGRPARAALHTRVRFAPGVQSRALLSTGATLAARAAGAAHTAGAAGTGGAGGGASGGARVG
ncbi:hypothetical protein PJM50_30700, partial [Mycobacterium kansasii]